MSRIEDQPFRLAEWFRTSPRRALLAPFRSAGEHVLGLRTLENLYRRLPRDHRPFCDKALEALDVEYEAADSQNIPRTGPLLVVANHPYGGLDGLVLASLLIRIRPDVKLLANYLLGRIPELRDLCFFVDPFGTPSGSAANAGAARSAFRWVRGGGALALFPAGEVSHTVSADGTLVDSMWTPALARLVRHTKAAVLPVFFEGGNSGLFRLAGRVHPALRTALLPREMLRQRHRTIAVRIGPPIPAARLEALRDDEQVVSYLRIRTYALGQAGGVTPARETRAAARAPVAAAEPPNGIAGEVAGLAPSQVLGRSGDLTVCVGNAGELPHTLREIGRLREIAFRAAGEGSGAAHDLDRFDAHYLHLFVWNHQRREIVGAYRIGRTDDILSRFGTAGLYTSTLFQYDRRLMAEAGPALELGRAFVRVECQRDYSPLLLLWKGIGTYVSRHPRYRVLFGPVSISNDYHSISRQILAAFVQATAFRPELARLVTPRNPPAFLRSCGGMPPVPGAVVRSLAEVGALLAEIEADRKGVPVLLRQYLKLNARLLGFNLDPAFGNALDALMLVDLMHVDRDILSRYMGRAAALAFVAHHGHAGQRRAS